MRKNIAKVLVVALVMTAGVAMAGGSLLSAAQANSDLEFIACNMDGTYVCGNDCWAAPNYGQFCCEF